MPDQPIQSSVSLISDTAAPCGVEAFARGASTVLSANAPGRHTAFPLTGQPGEWALLRRDLGRADALLVNLPIVAWKKRLVGPLRAMAIARRMGKQVVLVLHEWADLDWKRRASYLAYVPFATRLVFSSPLVRDQFAADRRVLRATVHRGIVPIPPNLIRPATVADTAISRAIAAQRASGRLVIGHFGSIYPKKHSAEVLAVGAALKAAGHPIHIAFIGSFIGGATVNPREEFDAKLIAHDMQDDVTVTGYIGPDAEVFAALEACDVFLYRFAEGLTSRRGSVLACLQTGRPVIVNAPKSTTEFDHHAAFRAAIDNQSLTLLSADPPESEVAAAVLAARARPLAQRLAPDATWQAAAAALRA